MVSVGDPSKCRRYLFLDRNRLPDGHSVLARNDNRTEGSASSGAQDSSSGGSTGAIDRDFDYRTEQFDIHDQAVEPADADSLGGSDDSGRRDLDHLDLLSEHGFVLRDRSSFKRISGIAKCRWHRNSTARRDRPSTNELKERPMSSTTLLDRHGEKHWPA